MGARANYSIVRSDAQQIVIRDEGPWDRHLTITNDAEAIVAGLHESGSLRGRKLLYYDSDGQLDELVHEGGRFVRFAPGPR